MRDSIPQTHIKPVRDLATPEAGTGTRMCAETLLTAMTEAGCLTVALMTRRAIPATTAAAFVPIPIRMRVVSIRGRLATTGMVGEGTGRLVPTATQSQLQSAFPG
jgi:hypothetical protein